MTVHGPVHRSWVSFVWTQSLYRAGSAPFTKTKAPGSTQVPVEVCLIPAFWCSRRRRLCSWRCCRSLRTFCTKRRFSLLSAMRLCSLTMPWLSGLDEVTPLWIRQSRPNSERTGVTLPGSRGSGVVRCSHRAGCTYSFHRRGRLLQSSTRISWIHPPTFLQLLRPSGGPWGHSLLPC